MPDRTSIEAQIAEYRPALLTYAQRLRGDPHEAEDIVQSALVKALEAVRGGQEIENVRAWLYRITHNEALAFAKRARRARRAPPLVAPKETGGARADLLGRVQRELLSLDEPYRSALCLRFLQHLKVGEVADVLDLPLGTVKAQIARGLRQLTERLGKALDGEVQ